jgi:LCP family protein required for cell wall assembly
MTFAPNRFVLGAGLALIGGLSAAVGYWGVRSNAPGAAGVAVVSAPARVASAVQTFFVPDPRKLFGKDFVRVLLVGLDYDYDERDQETSKQSRSDIIMAIQLNLRDHRVAELSVPRDMVATMPDGSQAKINAAQSFGGIRESQQVVSKWLGIPGFDRYVVLRIDTAKDIVNAIGGVDVDVKNSDALKGTGPNGPIDYDDHWGHLAIHLKPGRQHLDGENAVAYARFRHDWCSDPCRIMRQQQLIHAVVDKLERDKFNTLTHIQSLLAVVHNDVETDISPREQLSTAVAYAHLTPKDITTAQVPYASTVDLGAYGDSLVPDVDARKKLVDTMLRDPSDSVTANSAAGSGGVARVAATAPVPGDIRLRVENGTHVPGLAARIAADLQRRGFVISDVADADSHDVAVTQLHGRNDSAPALEVVRQALGARVPPTAALVDAPATTEPGTVIIVLGADIAAALPAQVP